MKSCSSNSIQRRLKLNCFCFIPTLALFSVVTAQPMPVYTLEEVIVTVSRKPTFFERANRSVFVMTRSEIEAAPAGSVQELLEYAAGVDLQPRGPNGVQADVSIRGSTYEQTLILINGVKVSDPQTGHHNLNIPLTPSDIERIEILRGHGSRLYGPNALGGVINIITRRGENRSASFSAARGEFGLYEGTLSISYPFGNIRQRLSTSRSRSDGYRKASEFDITSALYGSAIRTGSGDVDLLIGYQDKEFGANSFYSDRFPNEWEHTTVTFSNLSGRWSKSRVSFTAGVNWRKHRDDFVLDNDRPDWYRNNHTTDVYGAEFQSTFNSELGTVSIGGEIGNETIESSNLGSHKRDKTGLFIEHQLEMKRRFEVSWGAFAYKYSGWGWKLWPGIDLGIRLNRRLRVYGTVGGSFRVPTFTELYYDSPANKGNPNLIPERALSYEAGGVLMGNGYRVNLALFRREGSNQIDWVRADPNEPWIAGNIASLNTNGVELSFDFFPSWYFPKSPLSRLHLSYAWLTSDKKTEDFESKYTLNHLRHQILLNVDHTLPFNLRQTWKLRYKDRFEGDDHLIVDMRIQHRIKSWEIFLTVTNLFDTSYEEIGSVAMPGRWFRAGFNLNLWGE